VSRLKSEAVCIRRWDWSETSQTVLLLTRDAGLLRGLAKGALRPGSAFSGGFEPLTRGQVVASTRTSGALAPIIAWELLDAYPGLRRSLRSLDAGWYVADLVQHALTDADPHPGLYDALVRALEAIQDPPAVPAALLHFQWALLAETGYRPVLDRDVVQGGPLPRAPTYRFVPARGGLTSDRADDARHAASWRVRAETVRALASIAGGDNTPPPPRTVERAGRLLGAYLRYILGRELPTARAALGPLDARA
jgi:DNA repair protein RecO (recombination protein O)